MIAEGLDDFLSAMHYLKNAVGQTGRVEEARAARAAASRAVRGLPVAAFPAVAHAALTDPGENALIKRLRLIWATATGRI